MNYTLLLSSLQVYGAVQHALILILDALLQQADQGMITTMVTLFIQAINFYPLTNEMHSDLTKRQA